MVKAGIRTGVKLDVKESRCRRCTRSCVDEVVVVSTEVHFRRPRLAGGLPRRRYGLVLDRQELCRDSATGGLTHESQFARKKNCGNDLRFGRSIRDTCQESFRLCAGVQAKTRTPCLVEGRRAPTTLGVED